MSGLIDFLEHVLVGEDLCNWLDIGGHLEVIVEGIVALDLIVGVEEYAFVRSLCRKDSSILIGVNSSVREYDWLIVCSGWERQGSSKCGFNWFYDS